VNNANELRRELSAVFKGLREGSIKSSDAAELANLAGKMINSAKAQVEYYDLRKEAPSIQFLDERPGE
jgi:hypothetical protein